MCKGTTACQGVVRSFVSVGQGYLRFSGIARGRPRMAWMDNINTWTGLPVEESVKMTEDRDKWRTYSMYSMMWPTLGSTTAKEQNRTGQGLGPQTRLQSLDQGRVSA